MSSFTYLIRAFTALMHLAMHELLELLIVALHSVVSVVAKAAQMSTVGVHPHAFAAVPVLKIILHKLIVMLQLIFKIHQFCFIFSNIMRKD